MAEIGSGAYNKEAVHTRLLWVTGGWTMATIEVIYEQGVLRPVEPLPLPEGTRLVATLTALPSPAEAQPSAPDDAHARLLAELDTIAALPLQSAPQPHTARDHDHLLYPSQG